MARHNLRQLKDTSRYCDRFTDRCRTRREGHDIWSDRRIARNSDRDSEHRKQDIPPVIMDKT